MGVMTMRSKAVDELEGLHHGIIIGVASGKQGKSCMLHTLGSLVPNLAARPHYLLDLPGVDTSVFPGYIATTKDKIDDIPNGSLVFIEDICRVFPSRGSGADPTLQNWIGVISHKRLILMVSAQDLADVDLALFRSQNLILLHKWMFDEDLRFERPEFADSQAVANMAIAQARHDWPDVDPRAFCYSSRYHEVLILPVIDWWSDNCAYYLHAARVVSQRTLRQAARGGGDD